jgi:multidrug efflux pump subunit AcrB
MAIWALPDSLPEKFILTLVVLAGIVALTVLLAKKVPTGFVPEEDNGYFIMAVRMPDAASLQEQTG